VLSAVCGRRVCTHLAPHLPLRQGQRVTHTAHNSTHLELIIISGIYSHSIKPPALPCATNVYPQMTSPKPLGGWAGPTQEKGPAKPGRSTGAVQAKKLRSYLSKVRCTFRVFPHWLTCGE
jgi:hypothetical protein